MTLRNFQRPRRRFGPEGEELEDPEGGKVIHDSGDDAAAVVVEEEPIDKLEEK